uniref:Integrin alpha-6-like n=1 Tax=Salarias fasciatus TaxID=181472 RepID=A0A672ISU2_SALFA
MERRVTCGLWLAALLSGCARLSAFNLDTENVLKKTGDPGSLFGFSLALHQQLQPEDKRMLLVGAPRAKSLSGQQSKVTGGLYSCDMSTPSGPCSRIDFDNDEDLSKESKENQWMGVTVNSQGPGGKIVTCAHRYQRRNNVNTPLESRDIIGRCYTLSQDLTINYGFDGDGGDWHFCDNRPRGHEMFGSCQQGLSATFDKDYHYVIFGAPGAYNWKGVVRLEQKNDSFIEMGIYDDGPFEAGDEREKKPELVPAAPNSYMGFSLDSGKDLTTKGQLTVVAGAPRANHSGSVVLLKTGGDTSNIMVAEYTLDGEGLASSFGYDLAVLDLNKDGWQDIVVGAPQYFEKDGTIGGAVYVYLNKGGKWNKVTPTRINGPQDSMFGLSVENLGDINQDGYHDFAVGAPYDDDGAGTVFIYHGSDTGEISGRPLNVKLFGYSLAGNMDLDKNSYPDLAIGSLSDAVFVFKSRPVINIKKEIKFIPPEIDLTKKNCGNTFCLEVQACFTYSANPDNYAPRLTVAYSLEADADQVKKGLSPRATFTGVSGSDPSHKAKGTLVIDGKGKKKCINPKLAIQENIRDKLRGIPIDVSVEIQDSKRKRRQSSGSPGPVLDANEPSLTRSEVDFLKEGCGTDNVCQSNLQITYRYGHRTPDEKSFTPLDLENGVPVISLSDQKDVALEVKVTNLNGDDAHEASVIASFPRSLTYSTYRSAPGVITCIANRNGSMADCELGNPFKRDAEATFYIILGTSGISPSTSELEIDLQLETEGKGGHHVAALCIRVRNTDMRYICKIHTSRLCCLLLTVHVCLSRKAQPSQVYFTGDVKGETAMKTEADIGSALIHQFRIINLAKRLADFGTPTLNIDWPKETEDGKWLLYLMKISSTGIEQMECTPKAEVNPLNKVTIFSNTRVCDRKGKINLGAKCVRIKCPLRGMDSTAVITLKSRLWNSTFIEVTKLFHSVIVNASIHFDKAAKNIVLRNDESQVTLTVFPERREAQYGGVPWWIIVLSVLLGLLLLGLLAFLLWKCGFFKRARYEEKVPSYSAVRIRREERATNPGNGNWENVEKKPWMTTWHDNEHYS